MQRYKLTVREKDMFSRTWKRYRKKGSRRANGESGLTKLRNPTVCRMAWSYQCYDKPVIM